MMSKDDIPCFTNISSTSSRGNLNIYTNMNNDHSSSLLYNLSILKEKFHHLQSLVTVLASPNIHQQIQNHQESSLTTSNIMSMSNITTLVQEVIVTASSMMFTCQQMGIINNTTCEDRIDVAGIEDSGGGGQGPFSCDAQNLDWYGDNLFSSNTNTSDLRSISIYSNNIDEKQSISRKTVLMNNCDIIEMEASDLLAKYTHYCQICGKGFKRDANLRMHMRAHGDQYKTTAALSKKSNVNREVQQDELPSKLPRKYSCPHEGCRWNSKHAKFQPLKSMICVKNHYKRSHCPKMYVCKRCSQKQFSVLSDLRTHEKHCGDLKWLCSCGTTFSRKDKLMGHVSLFVGHSPAIISSSTIMHS